MSMLFPYTTFSLAHAIWPLFGRTNRPRPLILVSLLGSAATTVVYGVLDTGSDDTVFPDAVAVDLGIDLANAPTGSAAGVGQVPATLRYAEVVLRITDGREFREWTARIGFTSAPLNRPLLGFAGFLQYFTATFHGDLEQVELAVNSSYQGK